MIRRGLFAAALATAAGGATPPAADAQTRLIHHHIAAEDTRDDYAVRLLRLGLDRSGLDYVLEMRREPMNHRRKVASLERGELDVAWFGVTADLERRLSPVYMPIYRGLLGHRVFIIRSDRQSAFNAVQTLEDLAALRAGQGFDWGDVAILRAAGLIVDEASYEALFHNIRLGRIDYFPRAVHEALPELRGGRNSEGLLALERRLLLVYPFASLFFTAPNRGDLADALSRGLRAAYDDGSFLALYESHPAIRSAIDETDMETRRRFVIANPALSDRALAIPDAYWETPPRRDDPSAAASPLPPSRIGG